MKHIHYSHRSRRPHHISLLQRINLTFFIPLALIVISSLITFGFRNVRISENVSLSLLMSALGVSFVRLLVSYALSLVAGIVLAMLALKNRAFERILLPIYDVLESVPVLVFFPVIIIFFIRYDFFNGAAVFIIFLNMLWNIVFNVVGGLRLMPEDLHAVSKIFGLSKAQHFFKIILPSIFPSLVTGSLLGWAEGWNMLIVAEVLHTYVPHSENVKDLFGIGSLLVNSSAAGNNALFIASVAIIVASIAFLNLFVWQGLLHYSSKFRFD